MHAVREGDPLQIVRIDLLEQRRHHLLGPLGVNRAHELTELALVDGALALWIEGMEEVRKRAEVVQVASQLELEELLDEEGVRIEWKDPVGA